MGINQSGKFDREFFDPTTRMTYIRSGELGGKAAGLVGISSLLESRYGPQTAPDIEVDIPTMCVVTTEIFDKFMERNNLSEIAMSDARDDRIASAAGIFGLQLAAINRNLVVQGLRYVLETIGRLGTSDARLGVPVEWSEVSCARCVVECTIPGISVDLGKGSHFFHNVIAFEVFYFSVKHTGSITVDFEWLNGQKVVEQTEYIRHVRLDSPLRIKVDSGHGRGVINR